MTNSRKTAPNILWAFGERISAQLVTLIVSIVLARILTPNEYASVAVVMIFITFANVLVSSGYGVALIQKKDSDDYDFSTTLYFSLALSVIFYVILFFTAPFISSFFNIEILTTVIRVLGVRLIFAAINTIQHAYVSKQMAFKKFFLSTLIGTVISSVIGVAMALSGFGVWAIVAQYLSNTIIDTLVLSLVSGWRPKLYFSFKRFRKLFPFGSAVLLVDLISTTYTQLRGLLLGKFYQPTELSYYNQADKYSAVFVTNVETSVNKVMIQVQSDSQEERARIKDNTKKTVRFVMLIIAPLQIGLAVTSFCWVPVLLGSKWIGCIPYVIVTTIFYLFYPLIEAHTRNIKALGKGKTLLLLHTIRYSVGVGVIVMCVALFDQAWILCLAAVPVQIFAYVLFAIYDGKIIDYKIKEQFKDIAPILFAGIVMGAIVYFEKYLPFSNLIVLIIQVATGIVIYSFLAWYVARNECLRVISFLKKIKSSFSNRKKLSKKSKILILSAVTATSVVVLGGISIYFRSVDSSQRNLLSLRSMKYVRDNLSIIPYERNSYLVSGQTDKNVSVTIGSGTLKKGKYKFNGMYSPTTNVGSCRLQLFTDSSSSSPICQFGGCTSKEYSYINFEIGSDTTVQARMMFYGGWSGKVVVSPYLTYLSSEEKVDTYFGMESFSKPMMTIIDDDGNDEFNQKWTSVMEECDVPITCAVVTDWASKYEYCMNWDEIKLAQNNGAEIVCHTEKHDEDYYMHASTEEIIESYKRAKQVLSDHDISTDVIVYNGSTGDSANVRSAGREVFNIGIHSGGDIKNSKSSVDLFNIKRYNLITENRSFDYYKDIIDNSLNKNEWLVWMSHSQYEQLDDELLETIKSVIEYSKSRGIEIVTVKEAYERIVK